MKKLLWFTKRQEKILDMIKEATRDNNSEIVREAMRRYAIDLKLITDDSEK